MPDLVLPREGLYRAGGGLLLRGSTNDPELPGEPQDPTGEPGEQTFPAYVTGHFARFNSWTEINSMWEGNFLERIAPGAFTKTFRENRAGMRCLFQHGRDPQVGDKPLGPIRDVSEDDLGARYDVELLDTSYNRDLIPGLRSGLYGASFRFSVVREEIIADPARSDYNPKGLPERTVREAKVSEFGPVTFPAYADATAGLRSFTDEMVVARFAGDLDRFLEVARAAGVPLDVAERLAGQHHQTPPAPAGVTPDTAPSPDAGQQATSGERRDGYAPAEVFRNPRKVTSR